MGILRRVLAKLARRDAMLEGRVRDGLKLGERVHVGQLCFIDPAHCKHITIGDGATIAARVTILAHDASTKKIIGKTRVAPVWIGRECFIGAGAIILPGVTIGDGAIVGAGSVVTKDVPAGMLVVGNPARVVMSVAELGAKHRERMELSTASYIA
jgi:maltose O-acetyltransferase